MCLIFVGIGFVFICFCVILSLMLEMVVNCGDFDRVLSDWYLVPLHTRFILQPRATGHEVSNINLVSLDTRLVTLTSYHLTRG